MFPLQLLGLSGSHVPRIGGQKSQSLSVFPSSFTSLEHVIWNFFYSRMSAGVVGTLRGAVLTNQLNNPDIHAHFDKNPV